MQPHTQTLATNLAAYHVWAATGRRYGLCELTVQPCNPMLRGTDYATYPAIYEGYGWGDDGGGLLSPYIGVDGEWRNAACGSGCSCSARQPCEVHLDGPTTKARISQVTVAGVVVNPNAYVVFDGYRLTRIDGTCWPTCVSYTDQDPIGFSVTYTRGDPIPEAIQSVFEVLVCEYGKWCTGGPCRLPSRVTSISRQGVDVEVDPVSDNWEDLLRTGIPMVDAILAADNPGRRRERPQVLSPDLPPPRTLT